MRDLFNKAIIDQDTNAKYAIYELQYQVYLNLNFVEKITGFNIKLYSYKV